jgi:DegV family protein with EDD domain
VNLTFENTAVVLDSASDFSDAPACFANFRVVPLYVHLGGESFRDYVDITPEQFYERLRAENVSPTTAQPTPADFLAVYDELADRYERILALPISSTLSGTYESARKAAELHGGARVRVLDTRTVSASLALLALGVARRLARGTTDDEIDAFVARYGREHRLVFTVSTLDYLARGGRIGRAAALAGNLLNVRPILTIRDGEVVPVKKVRGNQKAFAEFRSQFESTSTDSPSLEVGIAHAAAPERLEALRELVGRIRPRAQIEIATELGAVIGTHAGPGTVGLFWFADEELG